jgi:Fe-S-cluster containining protein
MLKIDLKLFRKKVASNKSILKRFLTRLENKPPRGLDLIASETNIEMWKEVDCLSCANCCKTMSPTYTGSDMKRIATHLNMSIDEFKIKYLYKDKQGDWLNKQQPCQFLNLEDNKCSIYPIRPRDCAGFPHHTKRRMVDYMHVYKQNIEYCPATYRMVEKMRETIQKRMLNL